MNSKRDSDEQPPLFSDSQLRDSHFAPEQVLLYAMGEFQARGKALAERELALDRLRGAIRRAAAVKGVREPDDDEAGTALRKLGADVRRMAPYIAKHPYRVFVSRELAERARAYFDREAARPGG